MQDDVEGSLSYTTDKPANKLLFFNIFNDFISSISSVSYFL